MPAKLPEVAHVPTLERESRPGRAARSRCGQERTSCMPLTVDWRSLKNQSINETLES